VQITQENKMRSLFLEGRTFRKQIKKDIMIPNQGNRGVNMAKYTLELMI
jgi:hypothetical protein